MKRIIWIFWLISGFAISGLRAQTVNFSFSAAAHSVSGWINVAGDPSLAVLTGSDPSSGISISSVARTNWYQYSNTNCAYDGGGVNTDGFFPGAVFVNQWFQYNPAGSSYAVYVPGEPQLVISGLKVDSVYTLKMSGSNALGFNTNPVRYTVTGAAMYGYHDLNTTNNTASGVIINNIAPDSTGKIQVYVNTVQADNTEVADISGIQIICQRTTVPTPTVTFTSPTNNDILADDGNIILSATASETGGTIAKVEFYAGATKLGEATTTPYQCTWVNPNEGPYILTARAIDAAGVTNVATIQVSVESLSYFWTLTGNIAVNSDSFFLGTVDTSRLVIRTKNLPRMAIDSNGNVGIGLTHPTAQLHTTGSVRLAGITSDSTRTRVLVSDSSGNLFYRNSSSLSGRWLYANGVQYDSVDNIAIGMSTLPATDAKLAVNGVIYTKKIRVTQSGWPDYVFKRGYGLPSLAVVERYIRENRHLPGVISAKEVKEKGVDLGDNQSALVKKIEELTLYLIEEHKRATEQEKEIRQLKEQNKKLDDQQQEIDQLRDMLKKLTVKN